MLCIPLTEKCRGQLKLSLKMLESLWQYVIVFKGNFASKTYADVEGMSSAGGVCGGAGGFFTTGGLGGLFG